MSSNISKQDFKITVKERRVLNNHNSFLVLFTGLSGSGKSTIANKIEVMLHEKNIKTYILDGDNVRSGLNQDLTFSTQDRTENIRRISEVSKLMIDAGLVVLAAFVSPFEQDREYMRTKVSNKNFIEVYVNTSINECERRDVKGIYKMAREGKIKNMTGISSPYEAPKNPDIEIKTEELTIDQAAKIVLKKIEKKLIL